MEGTDILETYLKIPDMVEEYVVRRKELFGDPVVFMKKYIPKTYIWASSLEIETLAGFAKLNKLVRDWCGNVPHEEKVIVLLRKLLEVHELVKEINRESGVTWCVEK